MGRQFAPDTADGWAVIHQFFQVDWAALKELSREESTHIFSEFQSYLIAREPYSEAGQSAAYHVLGHKGELLLLHFRREFSDCAQLERELAQLQIWEFLELSHSYVSVVELGMYHVTKKIVEGLEQQALKPFSEEWDAAYREKIDPHKENLMERRYTEIPDRKYICFYPMNKRRGDAYNWYHEPLEKRAHLMMEHGMTGRRYAGKVQQIISGSIGFDDWEWGVDLFADVPNYFKDLVYEMRFDDATSLYGEFGDFFLGVRIKASDFSSYLAGEYSFSASKR